jgi:hypothetical protein
VSDASGVAIANGDTGTLQMLDAQTFAMRWTTKIGGDADNVRYDTTAKRLYVAAEGGLYAVEPAGGRVIGRIEINGHPESFELEATGTRVFANPPGILRSSVVAADRSSMAVTSTWQPQGCGSNYPMALDERNARLVVGCRQPARVALVDDHTGAVVGSADIVSDTDELFYDEVSSRVYVIGGGGTVDILSRDGARLERIGRVTTRAGARTGSWVASQRRLYVAVPARTGQSAEVRVFEAASAPR